MDESLQSGEAPRGTGPGPPWSGRYHQGQSRTIPSRLRLLPSARRRGEVGDAGYARLLAWSWSFAGTGRPPRSRRGVGLPLPDSGRGSLRLYSVSLWDPYGPRLTLQRSEERRVGKECRSRWSP